MKETFFMFDEEWENQKKELEAIFSDIENPEVIKNTFILETFVRGCAYTFVKAKPRAFNYEELKKGILARRGIKPGLINKILRIPVGVSVEPVPKPSVTEKQSQPIYQYKEIPQYVEKVVNVSKEPIPGEPERFKRKKRRLLEIERTPEIHKDLIKDRHTGTILASANIADKYILNEPQLDEADILILNKIKKKRRLKSMEKGWKLIKKYEKKFGIKEGHDTAIKYYIVNDILGLGRIEPLLHDNGISAIICDDYMKNIEVEFNEKKLETNLRFANKDELKEFVVNVARKMNKKIDKKNTIAEGNLRGFTFFLDMGANLENPRFSIRRA